MSSRSFPHSGLLDGCRTLQGDRTLQLRHEATRRATRRQGCAPSHVPCRTHTVSRMQGHMGPVVRHPAPHLSHEFRDLSSWIDARDTPGLSQGWPTATPKEGYHQAPSPPQAAPPGQRADHPSCLSPGPATSPRAPRQTPGLQLPTPLRHPLYSPRSDPSIANQHNKLSSFGPRSFCRCC